MTLQNLKCTWWYKSNQETICRTFFSAVIFCCSPAESLILVQPSLCVRPLGLCQVESWREGSVCLCERQWVIDGEGNVLPPVIPPPPMHVCLVCEGLRQLFDLMCFPDDLSVFTPHTLQSAKYEDLSLSESCILSFLAFLLFACFLFSHQLFVFGIGTSKTYNVCLSSCPSVSYSLFLLACFSLFPSLTFSHSFLHVYLLLSLLCPSPCHLPSSRQNQLKDQVQQALVSPGQLPEEAECLTVPKYKRDLVQKLKILRQELSQQQPQAGHCRIEVSREEIFEVNMNCEYYDTQKRVHNWTQREIQLSQTDYELSKLNCMTKW